MSTLEERFWQRVHKTDGCWEWTGPTHHGYGNLRVGETFHRAHRLAYELAVGPIPDGLQIDHVCHSEDESCPGGDTCPHRRCVNPAHLEPVTARENTLRSNALTARFAERTHCERGHKFTDENTLTRADGHRRCLTCLREWNASQAVRERQRRKVTCDECGAVVSSEYLRKHRRNVHA